MAVDYKTQYEPHQLEPFWPNEIVRMAVVVLCTLAVIMVLVVLPTVLEWVGFHGLVHEDEPANPRVTPEHIKPEWYFLAVYQYLKLMEYPQQWFGVDGKMLGVMSQGVLAAPILLLPFWYRRRATVRAGFAYHFVTTLIIVLFLVLTFAAIWPPSPLFVVLTMVAMFVFYVLLIREQRAVNRLLHGPKPPTESRP